MPNTSFDVWYRREPWFGDDLLLIGGLCHDAAESLVEEMLELGYLAWKEET